MAWGGVGMWGREVSSDSGPSSLGLWSLGAEHPRCPWGSALTLTLGLGLGPRRAEGLRKQWGPPRAVLCTLWWFPTFPWDHLHLPAPAVLLATFHHEKDRPVVSERPEGDVAGQTPQAGPSTLGGPASSPAKQTVRPPPACSPPRLPPCEAFVMLQGSRPCGHQVFITWSMLRWGVLVTSEIPTGEGSVPQGVIIPSPRASPRYLVRSRLCVLPHLIHHSLSIGNGRDG